MHIYVFLFVLLLLTCVSERKRTTYQCLYLHCIKYISFSNEYDCQLGLSVCVCVCVSMSMSSKTKQFKFMIDIALHLRQNKCKYQFRFYVLRSNIHDRFQINEILRIFNQNRDREREKKRQFMHLTEFFNTTSLFFPNIQSVVRIKAINLVR